MYKLFAAVLISAVCMSLAVHGQSLADARTNNAAAQAVSSPVNNLNPALIDYYGYQVGSPLLSPNIGPFTTLLAAAMPPRSYVGGSNPVLIRDAVNDLFIGSSSIGIVAL